MSGLPRLLRAAGYYCTNNSKTDYNFTDSFAAGWHESGHKAHWRKRPDRTQPFFAVFNRTVTHESGLFGKTPAGERERLPAAARTEPSTVRVPPWYPDTPIIRRSLASRLDLAAALDREVAGILGELAADGLADDTIIVFWGDHGEGIPHGKRSLTEHGLRVPLVVHVPPRFAAAARLPGGRAAAGGTDNLVSLVDLGPTMLDLAGVPIPGWMEGRSFLGPHAVARDVVIGARDRMDASPGFGRTVRDARFRYVRHFLPWIPGDDLPDFATGVPITGELRAARAAGTLPAGAGWFARATRPPEELFDVAADPEEVVDVASDPGHAAVAEERYDAILAAAWDVAEPLPLDHHVRRLEDPDAAVRFWAASGVAWSVLRPRARDERSAAVVALGPLLADADPAVRINAARWICRLDPADDDRRALDVLALGMQSDDPDVRLAALVSIDEIGDRGRALWETVATLRLGKSEEYSRRTVERIRARPRGAR